MAVTKRTRYEVLKRDNHTCRYCHATDSPLTVDHVTPTALGGSDDPSNLVAACKDCNAGKSSTSPNAATVEDVKSEAIRWSAALKQAAQTLSAQREAELEYVGKWRDAWDSYTWNKAPHDAENSVVRLRQAGLPIEEVVDAVLVAAGAWQVQNRFSYFMGICWKRVTLMQDAAKQILAAEEVE